MNGHNFLKVSSSKCSTFLLGVGLRNFYTTRTQACRVIRLLWQKEIVVSDHSYVLQVFKAKICRYASLKSHKAALGSFVTDTSCHLSILKTWRSTWDLNSTRLADWRSCHRFFKVISFEWIRMSGFTDGLRNFDEQRLAVLWRSKSWIARGDQSALKSQGMEATVWNGDNT